MKKLTMGLVAICERGFLSFPGLLNGNAQVQHMQGETLLQLCGSQSVDNGQDKTIRVQCSMGDAAVLFAEEGGAAL